MNRSHHNMRTITTILVVFGMFSRPVWSPTAAQSNQPPTISDLLPQVVEVGQSITVSLSYADPDGDPLTVSSLSDNPAVASVTQTIPQEATIAGVAPGSASITVSVDDGRGGLTSAIVPVTVNAAPPPPNQSPVIDQVAPQVLITGQSITILINYSDPDGDDLTVSSESDNLAVASVTQTIPQELTITGASTGSAVITISVSDGRGGLASTTFPVTVNAAPLRPNQPPVINSIAPQVVAVGQSITVPLTISDPDADTITVFASSDNANLAGVSLPDTNLLTVNGIAVGVANVTLTISDGRGGIITITFPVTVNPPPNQAPSITRVATIIEVGQSLILGLISSDPDGDVLTVTTVSDNQVVASVTQITPQQITISTTTPGSATITINVDDGRGGIAATTYSVIVNPPPNQSPVIAYIAPQSVEVGQSVSLTLSYSDPDGDTLTITALSDNTAVVSVTQTAPPTITVTGLSAGSAVVTVGVDDGRGGTASTTFGMTVTPQTFTFAAGGDIGANSRADASLRAIPLSGAEFFLALGDMDYDETPSDAAWCDYVKARVGSTFPFEVLTGNHEEGSAANPGPDGYIGNHATCLPDYFGSKPLIPGSPAYPANYYFDYPQTGPLMRVIMITADLKFDDVQYNFNLSEQTNYNALAVRIDEARQSGLWVVIGVHKVCLTMGDKPCEIGADLMNLLIERKVDLVLHGHDHNYQRSKQIGLGTSCSRVSPDAYNPNCIVDDGSDNMYTGGAGPIFVVNGNLGRCCYTIQANDSEAGYFAKTVGVDGVNTNGFVAYTVTMSRIDARVVNSVGNWSDNFSIVRGSS